MPKAANDLGVGGDPGGRLYRAAHVGESLSWTAGDYGVFRGAIAAACRLAAGLVPPWLTARQGRALPAG